MQKAADTFAQILDLLCLFYSSTSRNAVAQFIQGYSKLIHRPLVGVLQLIAVDGEISCDLSQIG